MINVSLYGELLMLVMVMDKLALVGRLVMVRNC